MGKHISFNTCTTGCKIHYLKVVLCVIKKESLVLMRKLNPSLWNLVYMESEVVLCLQGHWCRSSARAGLRGPPQLSAHGPEEPLRLLPAPRGLLLSGPAGRAVHPAAAWEQEEAAAPDAGRWGAVPTPPAGQEEEGQCAAVGHSQPRDLRDSWKSGLCSNHSLCIQNIYICHVHAGEDNERYRDLKVMVIRL